jgi:hypothetical protein
MRLIQSRLQRHLAAEAGFSMVLVLMVMIATGMFVVGGFAAANGDLPISRDSQDRKAAYAAAESGVQFYQFHLNADNDYWLKCDDVPAPNATELNPVNQIWNGQGADPRRWRNVAGSDAQYTIELVPATGKTECVNNQAESMVDPGNGTFRIRVTGRPGPTSKLRRTLNATFRRSGFLDYLYFTHWETQDPMAYATAQQRTDADKNCKKSRSKRPSSCVEIQFPSHDNLHGPLHTNDDSVMVCGTPTFGRNAGDKLEVAGTADSDGWVQNGGCSGQPTLSGPFRIGAPTLTMPPTNNSLNAVAQSGGLLLRGKSTIQFLSTGGMKVWNANAGLTGQVRPLPANGVIYNDTLGTVDCTGSPLTATYNEGAGCAKLYVSGQYTGDLTLASADDIIIKPNATPPANSWELPDANLTRNGDYVLGLIAENYVRVYHKVDPDDCNKNLEAMKDATIEAAILSVKHSFIVDNYRCGQILETLTVKGAIGQWYRGPVGLTGSRGYQKDYWYDDRLRYRTPPYFLNPVEVQWNVMRINEQIPAVGVK